MIKIVTTKKQLRKFIYFVKNLYGEDKNYAFPIFYSLEKELAQKVLKEKTYTALMFEENGQIKGRILYTVAFSKDKKGQVGYFSFFDCVNDVNVAKALFEHMHNELKRKQIYYVEGTFCPYNPDTRRGILVKGFSNPHTFLTSYNAEYYQDLVECLGYKKEYDTFTMELPINQQLRQKLNKLSTFFHKHHDVDISSLNLKNIDKEVNDIHAIFAQATNELNYQAAPSKEEIYHFLNSFKMFLNPDIIKIARQKCDGRAIGFVVCLPDFNQLLKQTKGKLKIFKFLRMKKKLTSVRGMLQYVVPDYQKSGLLYAMYFELFESFDKFNITTFEGGTILERNTDSWQQFEKIGGSLSKIYRIYSKEI